jgi:AraC-like DNA-binding protein
MLEPPNASIDVLRTMFALATARGLDEASLCARFGVSSAELEDPDARVGKEIMQRAWRELPALTGIESFGLEVAQRAPLIGTLTVIAYLQYSARTVGEGLLSISRYVRLLKNTMELAVDVVDDDVRIEVRDTDPSPVPRHPIEFIVARAILIARKATGRAFTPRAIMFRHSPPADDTEARRLFACELTYGAPANMVVVRGADLELPQLTSDPDLAAFFQSQARALEASYVSSTTFVAQVRRVLASELVHGSTSLEQVAKRLGVSERTLQRRLHDEDTTLHEVLDQLRRDLAAQYLDESQLGLREIAFLLGFAEQSGFQRAFVRWFGQTPRSYRMRQR